ncbi:hypothetical protein ACNKHM_10730 [Shigella sonnei]
MFIVERVVEIVTAVQDVIPLRWGGRLTPPVPFHFLHYAKSSTSRLSVLCRRLTCCTSDGKWHCRMTGNPRNC